MPLYTKYIKTNNVKTKDDRFYGPVKKVEIWTENSHEVLHYDKCGFLIEECTDQKKSLEVEQVFDTNNNLVLYLRTYINSDLTQNLRSIEKTNYVYSWDNKIIEEIHNNVSIVEENSIPNEIINKVYRVQYIYDENGLLHKVIYSDKHWVDYFYDKNHKLIREEEQGIEFDSNYLIFFDEEKFEKPIAKITYYQYYSNKKVSEIKIKLYFHNYRCIEKEISFQHYEDITFTEKEDNDDTLMIQIITRNFDDTYLIEMIEFKDFDTWFNPTTEIKHEYDNDKILFYKYEYWIK